MGVALDGAGELVAFLTGVDLAGVPCWDGVEPANLGPFGLKSLAIVMMMRRGCRRVTVESVIQAEESVPETRMSGQRWLLPQTLFFGSKIFGRAAREERKKKGFDIQIS